MTGSDNELMGKPAAPRGRTRVLVIDDDCKLCRLIRDLLARVEFRLGLDSLLLGAAGERIQAVGNVIAQELSPHYSCGAEGE